MQLMEFKANSRGQANHGWLHSFHTFSFARYFNPNRMGFGVLRVLNEDAIAPSSGFGNHPHRDMEIISIPLKGELKHKDSMGNTHIITDREVQVMSAGTGIEHSEFNHLRDEATHFLQIWIMPKSKGIKPCYAQAEFDLEGHRNHWVPLVSPEGKGEALKINQEAYLSRGIFEEGQDVTYELKKSNHGLFLMCLSGAVSLKHGKLKNELQSKDAVGLWDTDRVKISINENTDLLAIEVPMY